MPSPKTTSTGKCQLCGGAFAKTAMTKHLQVCRKGKIAASAPAAGAGVFHLVVEGGPAYWLHLEAPVKISLEQLDGFLRTTWLECCGHMSRFEIGGQCYVSSGEEEMDALGMDYPLSRVLHLKMTFRHEYDMGSTTTLRLKVVSQEPAGTTSKGIALLARNDPPSIPCGGCGAPAVQVCGQCAYDEKGWLCAQCAPKHECGEDMLLPVLNSPRTGVCGYAG